MCASFFLPRHNSFRRISRYPEPMNRENCPIAATTPIGHPQILKAAASNGFLGASARDAPRIMAALCQPGVDADQITALISKEPSLYARVLRVANSAIYGQSRAILRLDRAIVLLGLDSVRTIAAAACLDRTFKRTSANRLVDMGALMIHSQATAIAAQSLARLQHPELASEAFIAGLLHNLGIALQIQLDGPGVEAMIREGREGAVRDMRALETDCCMIGHEECIAVVFEAWKMPESLVACVRHHHRPADAPEPYRSLAALINLGASLALATGHTFTLEPAPVARDQSAMADLLLDEEALDEVAASLPVRVAELGRALGTE
jgi:HD-like signal output (HDOD) protein